MKTWSSQTMLIYEVSLDVELEIAPAFFNWLKPHIKEVLETGAFKNSQVFRVENEDASLASFVVQYHAVSEQMLETYLHEHAPRLRKSATDQFGSRFKAKRRILRSLEETE